MGLSTVHSLVRPISRAHAEAVRRSRLIRENGHMRSSLAARASQMTPTSLGDVFCGVPAAPETRGTHRQQVPLLPARQVSDVSQSRGCPTGSQNEDVHLAPIPRTPVMLGPGPASVRDQFATVSSAPAPPCLRDRSA